MAHQKKSADHRPANGVPRMSPKSPPHASRSRRHAFVPWAGGWAVQLHPMCDIPSGCCSFTGPWTVTRSSLRMLRRVAAFCRPLRPVLLPVSFPRSRSPVVGLLGLCWLRRDVPFARHLRPVVAGCCGGRLTVVAAHTPPSSGRPKPASLRFRVREAQVPCSSTRCTGRPPRSRVACASWVARAPPHPPQPPLTQPAK